MIIFVNYIGYFGISYVSSSLDDSTHLPPQSINKTSSSSSISRDANTIHAQSNNNGSSSTSISRDANTIHAQSNNNGSYSSSISNNKGKQKETIPFQSPGSIPGKICSRDFCD